MCLVNCPVASYRISTNRRNKRTHAHKQKTKLGSVFRPDSGDFIIAIMSAIMRREKQIWTPLASGYV